MSIFAIVGSLFRMVLAQLFGEECKNPGTIGWLKAGQPLCVTADGDTSISGGIIFADFPANLLGSFIMGLMQSTDTMDLPKALSIAWLHEDHIFQSFDIIHLAIKTGFCGSLTTFSSWNSEMVMMFLGEDSDRGSLIFRALFGYFIGVETCVASFILGKNIARYIFARVNPALQLEAAEIERRKQCGVYINTELADYERRFLSGFKMGEHSIYISAEAEEQLNKWKVSTEQCRRNGHNLLPLLTDVEYQAMALGEPLTRELIVPSVEAGWDIEALENWVYMKRKLNLRGGGGPSGHDFKFTPAFTLFSILFCAMFFGLILMDSNDAYSVTNRTMLFAGLLAPLGALLRWKLSDLNGSIQRYNWFPLGTFYANVSASLLSAAMIGLESHFYGHNSFWGLGTVRAIKVGFTGCLSTVSTFVTEVAGFIKSPNPMYGYMYVFVSIFTAALCGAIAFSVIELAEEEYYY
jgi:CrcB protein